MILVIRVEEKAVIGLFMVDYTDRLMKITLRVRKSLRTDGKMRDR